MNSLGRLYPRGLVHETAHERLSLLSIGRVRKRERVGVGIRRCTSIIG
jgi:hypothetical protein